MTSDDDRLTRWRGFHSQSPTATFSSCGQRSRRGQQASRCTRPRGAPRCGNRRFTSSTSTGAAPGPACIMSITTWAERRGVAAHHAGRGAGLVQDIVFLRGKRRNGLYPTIASFGARASISWHEGTLVAQRGPCVVGTIRHRPRLVCRVPRAPARARGHPCQAARRGGGLPLPGLQDALAYARARCHRTGGVCGATCPTPQGDGFNVTQDQMGFQCASGRYSRCT